jgi:hypothetical protein
MSVGPATSGARAVRGGSTPVATNGGWQWRFPPPLPNRYHALRGRADIGRPSCLVCGGAQGKLLRINKNNKLHAARIADARARWPAPPATDRRVPAAVPTRLIRARAPIHDP